MSDESKPPKPKQEPEPTTEYVSTPEIARRLVAKVRQAAKRLPKECQVPTEKEREHGAE